jgi:hypothetical protein
MTRAGRKGRTSFFRRIVYFAIVLISGGGAGGYAFQSHPVVQSLLSLITGKAVDGASPGLDGSLVTEIVDAIKPRDSFSQPGLYEVIVAKVELDQKLFKPGHTVDIQARVHKLKPGGRDTTIWDAKAFGSRLAVVGKDALVAGWADRPFQVEWNPGDQFVLEVYDARTNLFVQPRHFILSQAGSTQAEFPLKSGDIPLESAQKSDSAVDPRSNHVVLESQRLGEPRAVGDDSTQVAERPIVIK